MPGSYAWSAIGNLTATSGTFPLQPLLTNLITIGNGNIPFLSAVDNQDTTPGYLGQKLIPGTGVTFATNNPSANETITVSASGGIGLGATNLDGTLSVTGATNISAAGLSNNLVTKIQTSDECDELCERAAH